MDYLRETGRSAEQIGAIKGYCEAQGIFGIHDAAQIEYTKTVTVDLSEIEPSVAGPKNPKERIAVSRLKGAFNELYVKPVADGGFGLPAEKRDTQVTVSD